MYRIGLFVIRRMAATSFGPSSAYCVSTTVTECSSTCIVVLPPAPTNMYTLPCTGRAVISTLSKSGGCGFADVGETGNGLADGVAVLGFLSFARNSGYIVSGPPGSATGGTP